MKVDQIHQQLLKEAKAEGRDVQKEYLKTVKTWKGDKPRFESLVEVSGEDVVILTGPVGSGKGVDKFRWLDEGTRVRYALMSSDWKSKTKPGVVGSSSGRGRVIMVSRRRPRPGIKARGWTPLIQQRRKPFFINRMVKAARTTANDLY